ncbi:MAG: hypothetical protein N2505_06970, partial [Endomicrobia bacterium]|nr:hypothetical protein [Endomicrobiia bacterium]
YIIVSEYFASKIGIKKESLTIEEITKFYSNKISNELSINITDLWNEINFYKFSPWKPENSEFSNYISKTKELLRKLEDETKKI